MNINYDSKNDSLCFSKGQERTTIFNISEFWSEMIENKVYKQTFSYILQGKKVVEVRNNFSYGREPCCDVYSGNRAEITVIFYCNVISIQMVFYMQERRLTYLYWDDDSSVQLDNQKQYLSSYIKVDKFIELLANNINRDSLGNFIIRLHNLPRKKLRKLNLNAWNLQIEER